MAPADLELLIERLRSLPGDFSQVLAPIWEEVRGGRQALERIAAALERVVPVGVDPLAVAEAQMSGCRHPENDRVEFSSMGPVQEFFCRACETHVRVESQS